MAHFDLMGDPEDELSANEIRKRADRVVFMHEFAVAYQEPGVVDSERGYLTAWVRNIGIDADYERKQGMSGDDRMIRRMFGEMAQHGPDEIELFIGE